MYLLDEAKHVFDGYKMKYSLNFDTNVALHILLSFIGIIFSIVMPNED